MRRPYRNASEGTAACRWEIQTVVFKRCPKCGYNWGRREEFLRDPSLELVGYQPHFEEQILGFFLFTHTHCGTTLNLPVDTIQDLYNGPVFTGEHVPAEDANHYCFHSNSSQSCPSRCECTAIRELSRIIRQQGIAVADPPHLETGSRR